MFSQSPTRHVTRNEEETRAFGAALAADLVPGSLVAMSGELGTGKTTLMKGICGYFHCDSQVTSPTFTIVNEYRGTSLIFHADLYRINRSEELEEIGFEDFARNDAVTIIEWAERAWGFLPVPRVEILCDYGEGECERVYTVLYCREDKDSLLVPAERETK
jgi:tRNA threonylcarbamoyladenosine biosynthesis protein TsaE